MARVKKEIDHGTPAGYRLHQLRGEMACSLCKFAWRVYIREYRKKRG